ncbi:tyrosine-type recombinase/integrase [Rhodanobacter glycinis]|uniref:Tyrosine-type recombinase/integrase n=1 Tax=Rhodanobacter glycinis TaxID=582702 RepID=A0A5B9E344_9GAMM|nr:integrase arm-type DNA-binding domain-containing protein [Rhodanobacter glycinis]QEE24970.1 tyrosine-type recombinase/integrase [Rhodanobacter glycinis]
MALTDTAIRKAAPHDKPYKLSDGGGMYLEVMPTGAKYWRLKYRMAGKEKRFALGVYPMVSLASARQGREEARKLLVQGVDPSAARQEAKQAKAEVIALAADTFETVGREWMSRQEVADVTANKTRWILETFLFPEIGSRPISEITPRELLAALRKIEESGKLETAKRAKIKAGQIFRYAVLEGKVKTDPTTSLRGALKPPKNRHHAAITDPVQVGELLRAIDGFTGQPVTLAALKLAPLVFVRPGELRQAEWTEIDLDGAMWRIPPERMKMNAAHLVPLSKQVLMILRELHPLTGTGRYVFPGLRSASRPISENTVNAALRRLGYSNDEMTGHGFRSLAATRLNEMGWNSDAIERQLAHAESNKVREAYTHAAQYLDERKRMMQAWADYLGALCAGNKVIAIMQKAG